MFQNFNKTERPSLTANPLTANMQTPAQHIAINALHAHCIWLLFGHI